jgi:hypothetical protein
MAIKNWVSAVLLFSATSAFAASSVDLYKDPG